MTSALALGLGLGLAPSKGVGGPRIAFVLENIDEGASIGDLWVTLSTVNKPDDWGDDVYSIVTDADGIAQLDGADDTLLEVGGALDYETKTTHQVRIRNTPTGPYDPIERTITLPVGNVIEVPVFTVAPAITGSVGGTLTCSTGTLASPDGAGATFAYQWKDASDDSDLIGETGATIFGPDYVGLNVYCEVTATNSAGSTSADSNTVGPLEAAEYLRILLVGQSNMGGFIGASADPLPTPANVYGWNYDVGGPMGDLPIGNGIRQYANLLAAAYPDKVIYIAAAATGAVGAQYFNPSTVGLDQGWDHSVDGIAAMGGVDIILCRQGEAEANGTYLSEQARTDEWTDGWTSFHEGIEDHVGHNVPMLFASLATFGLDTPDLVTSTTDLSWSNIQAAIREFCTGDTDRRYFSHSIMDAVRNPGDAYHYNAPSFTKDGQRWAASTLTLLGDGAGFALPELTNPVKVDMTHTDIDIAHGLGTDFTPAAGITGFEVSPDNVTWYPATGVRASASRIRLTHTALGAGSDADRFVRYEYGCQPDLTGQVFDNSSIAAPLALSAGQLLVDYALPIMTSSAAPSVDEGVAYVMTLATSRPSTVAIGGPDAALFTIVGGQLFFLAAPDFEDPTDAGADNTCNITLTPTALDNGDVGPTQNVTVTVNDVEDGAASYAIAETAAIGSHLTYRYITADVGAAHPSRGIVVMLFSSGGADLDALTVNVGGTIDGDDPAKTIVGGTNLTLYGEFTNSRSTGVFTGELPAGSGDMTIWVGGVTAWDTIGLGVISTYNLASMVPVEAVGFGSGGIDVSVQEGDLVFSIFANFFGGGAEPSGQFAGATVPPDDEEYGFNDGNWVGAMAAWVITADDVDFHTGESFGGVATAVVMR